MGFFSNKLEQAKQYLANLAANGVWNPAKMIDDYKQDQILRKANAFKKQEDAGITPSNKAARGHADIIPARPAPLPTKKADVTVPAPVPAPKQRKDVTIIPAPRIPEMTHGPRGSYQHNTTRFTDVIRDLKRVAKGNPDQKVYFSLWDNRKGEWRKLYVQKGQRAANNGVAASDLVEIIKDKKRHKGMTEREALIETWEEDIAGDTAGTDTPDDLETPEVYTSISIHVMGV